jgi:hypothetical protein
MKKKCRLLLLSLLFFFSANAFAADSYRWLHVTIDTPWAIFLFLLPLVLIPVVLMAVLYWHFAFKSSSPAAQNESVSEGAEKK